MDFNRQNIFQATSAKTAVWDAGLRAYMLKVYNYMATGVLLTGIISLISFKMSVLQILLELLLHLQVSVMQFSFQA